MTLKKYKAKLTASFRRNVRSEFVDWRHTGRLADEVIDLLEEAAAEMLPELRDKELFDLVCAAYVKWGKTSMDDSNGETGIFISYVFEFWDQIYEREHPDIPHRMMLDWFLKKSDGVVIDYMEDELIKYMMTHFKEPTLLDKKLHFLNDRISAKETLLKEKSWEEYEIRQCRQYILQVYDEQARPIEEIRKYAGDHRENNMMELLADIELARGNQAECLVICSELYEQAEFIQTRIKYAGKLKDIYHHLGMRSEYEAKVKELVEILPGDLNIWREYKALLPEDEREAIVGSVLEKYGPGDWRLLSWYKEEERYDLIMAVAEQDSPSTLTFCEEELRTRYPERCLAVLINAANDMAEKSTCRREYRKIVKYLKWMCEYPGGNKKAAELAEQYCERYPRRPAMIDELREF